MGTIRVLILSLALLLLTIKLTPNYLTYVSSIASKKSLENPKYIQIPSLKINLPIETSKIKDNEWLLTNKIAAFYGEKSAYPGIEGTTIVFAHARQGLFAQLPALKEKNIIVLQTENKLYYYRVSEKKIIDPSDVFFLSKQANNDKNVLVIFTCYGFGDTKRIVFFAPLQIALPLKDYNKTDI